MKNIVCFGEVLWDVFPKHKKIGGAPLNVAVRLQSLNNKVGVISSIGNDNDGKKILQFIENNDVNIDNIQINKTLETGNVQVLLDYNGAATYRIEHPRAWDKIELTETTKKNTQNADAFIYGSLASRDEVSRKTLYELLKIANYKIFDVNLRAPHYSNDILDYLMKQANFIKFNDDEILEITSNYDSNIKTIEEAVKFIAKHTKTNSICVTKGGDGALLYYKGLFYQNFGYKINVVDTVGSGDSFLASLIDKLLKNTAPQNAIDFACAVGAIVASHEGANPVINPQDILALMDH